MTYIPAEKLREICSRIDGPYGLYVSVPGEKDVFTLHSDSVFYAASTIKIPILALLLQDFETGRLDPETPIPLSLDNRVGGSGVLKVLSHSCALGLYDYAVLMMVVSDNCATNQIIDTLGMDRINAFCQENGWHDTHLGHKMMSPKAKTEDFNRTSARDLGNMMERILQQTLVSPQASRTMLQIMAAQQVGKFDQSLPVKKHADPALPLPPVPEGFVYVSNKGGTYQGRALHDAAIILMPNGKHAVLVLTTNTPDHKKTLENFKEISRALYEALL